MQQNGMKDFSYLTSFEGVAIRSKFIKLKTSETWDKLYEEVKNTDQPDLISLVLKEKQKANEEAQPYKDLDKVQELYTKLVRLESSLTTDQEKELLKLIFLAQIHKHGINLNTLKAKFFSGVKS